MNSCRRQCCLAPIVRRVSGTTPCSNMACEILKSPFYPCQIRKNLPLLQLVRIESSVNSNQQRGSGSTTLDCAVLVAIQLQEENIHTMTGGNIAVVALGSTGCSIMFSSSPESEGLELDLNLLEDVLCVS